VCEFFSVQDPEVAAAFRDISSNPANMMKYQNNPKISAVIKKLATTFGGGMPGGFGGGFPGGFPDGFPPSGGTGGAPRAASGDDVGLD
jgi:suppressor of tumorigenicity protein 13